MLCGGFVTDEVGQRFAGEPNLVAGVGAWPVAAKIQLIECGEQAPRSGVECAELWMQLKGGCVGIDHFIPGIEYNRHPEGNPKQRPARSDLGQVMKYILGVVRCVIPVASIF